MCKIINRLKTYHKIRNLNIIVLLRCILLKFIKYNQMTLGSPQQNTSKFATYIIERKNTTANFTMDTGTTLSRSSVTFGGKHTCIRLVPHGICDIFVQYKQTEEEN